MVRTPETAGTVIAIVGTGSSTVLEDIEGGIQMSDFDDIIKSRLDPRAVVREEVSTEDGESLLNKVEVDKLDRGFRVLKKRRDIAYDDLIFPETPRKLPAVLSPEEEGA